jgi:hypothetical protein
VIYLKAQGVPLAKKFKLIAPGNYKETSYPHVSKFTSIEKQVDDLESFYLTTMAAANEGLCLLKGTLDRPLIEESRAGHTDASSPSNWICLDVDFDVTQTPEDFLYSLGLSKCGYVFQYSASQNIKTSLGGWRGHFFILLDSLQSPQALKQWLISLNLNYLESRIGLSASGGALTWPLDITTCQNDKLLFIAPPVCEGFEDEVTDRFSYRPGPPLSLDLSTVSAAQNAERVRVLINKLRHATNLPKKTLKMQNLGGLDILTNPDPVTVTGKKEAREFVYLNLNGGDSWAYYFPIDKPDILFNFKGEPCLYMKDVDKDIHNEYTVKPEAMEGPIPFGFLWPDNDTYYRGFANPQTKELIWLKPIGSKAKLRDFYAQHGVALPSGWNVDEWQIIFDPSEQGYADFHNKTVNTYKESAYIQNATSRPSGIPPVIDRVLTSVCVDETVKAHFINWLACIFQTRQKTNTAWIFQGVQGTGKGVLFSRIIKPLIGSEYCHEMTMDRLDDDFNAYLSDNIVLFIDEAKITDSRNGDRLLNRIKNLITEPEQHIRGMRANAVTRDNYSNIILASNYDEIIPIETSDRRFNVAPRQETPLQLEYADIVRIEDELSDFANYLHGYESSDQLSRQVLMHEARDKLIALSATTVDSFFLAIRKGDLSYFTQYLNSNFESGAEGLRYHDFAVVVKRWIEHANTERNLPRDELRVCYQYLQSSNISTTKFSRMAAKYNLDITPVRTETEVTRGMRGHLWYLSEEELDLYKDDNTDNVVRIRR